MRTYVFDLNGTLCFHNGEKYAVIDMLEMTHLNVLKAVPAIQNIYRFLSENDRMHDVYSVCTVQSNVEAMMYELFIDEAYPLFGMHTRYYFAAKESYFGFAHYLHEHTDGEIIFISDDMQFVDELNSHEYDRVSAVDVLSFINDFAYE